MKDNEVYILAEQTMTDYVNQIADTDWDLPVAAVKGQTVRQLVESHTKDDLWVADVLAGEKFADLVPKYENYVLGNDLIGSWNEVTARTQAATRDFDAFDRTVHLSFGDYSAREYLQQITVYRTLQAWDLANAIGANDVLPEDLVRAVWVQLGPVAEDWRAMGVFGPRLEAPEDADQQTKLLALAGRRREIQAQP